MADDIQVSTGSGIAIGGDLISSVLYQRVKLIYGADGVNSGDVAANNPFPVVVSSGTTGISGSVGAVSLTAANFNVVVSNGSIAILAGTTLIGTVSVTQLTAANLNCVVSNGSIALLAGTALVGTVSVTQLTAANLNVVVSNGTIVVNTVSTVGITGTVSTTEASAADIKTAIQIVDDWDDSDKCKVVMPFRTTKFQGALNASVATTAVTVVNGASTNANLHITAYLISASAAGTYWLEDGAGSALTPYHYLAANGGASFTAVVSEPLSTAITATTIKLKAGQAGSTGCLVLGYSA